MREYIMYYLLLGLPMKYKNTVNWMSPKYNYLRQIEQGLLLFMDLSSVVVVRRIVKRFELQQIWLQNSGSTLY